MKNYKVHFMTGQYKIFEADSLEVHHDWVETYQKVTVEGMVPHLVPLYKINRQAVMMIEFPKEEEIATIAPQ